MTQTTTQTPITFPQAELTLREQIRVRAEHPESADDEAKDDDERQGSSTGLALGVAGGVAENAVNKIFRRKK